MMNGRLNNEKILSFGSWKAPPNIGLTKYIIVLFINKTIVLSGQGCARSHTLRSSASLCALDRR